ncbi:MAG TPA: reverse transcriptase family protein, partial [Candidatus Saccharimonadales bacterium]
KLYAVDGRAIQQSGMIHAVVIVHGHIIPRPVRLIVIEKSAPGTTVILGNDFSRQHLVSNDPVRQTMQLKYYDDVIPLITEIIDDSIGVYSIMKEVIPPQSVVRMRVRMDERKLPELVNESKDGSVMFEPFSVNGVTMPPALVNAAGDREAVTITVNNLSNEQVTIDNDTRLGTLVTADVASAIEVIDQNNTQPTYMDADSEEVEDKTNSTSTLEIAPGVNISLDGTVLMENSDKRALVRVLKEHVAAFANHPKRVGITDLVQHKIDTGDSLPIHMPPYRLGPHVDGKIQEMVQDMKADSVIEESSSPWSSPVLLVKKKDGSMRFCIDFRRVNAVTKKDVYPMLRIDATLDALGKARFLSSLDMQSGYWQIALDRRDAEKTAFSTSRGHYQFLVMPFGLTNAPATFQRLMDNILRDFQLFCLVYIDDIIIFSETFEVHLVHLSKVLQRLIDSHLVVKPSKCQLLKQNHPS